MRWDELFDCRVRRWPMRYGNFALCHAQEPAASANDHSGAFRFPMKSARLYFVTQSLRPARLSGISGGGTGESTTREMQGMSATDDRQ